MTDQVDKKYSESLSNTIKEFDLLRRKSKRGTLYLTDVKYILFSNFHGTVMKRSVNETIKTISTNSSKQK